MTKKPLPLLLLLLMSALLASCAEDIQYSGDRTTNSTPNNDNPNNSANNNVGRVEICDDGQDNDLNGEVDCEDAACAQQRVCLTIEGEICDDGRDNDRDGRVDCEDSECSRNEACVIVDSEICDDGRDNDGDGRVDCDDRDCANDRLCVGDPREICFDACDRIVNCLRQDINCEEGAEVFGEACQNQFCFEDGFEQIREFANLSCNEIRNNLVPQLQDQGLCISSSEICNDGRDNDRDGRVDCEDRDCINDPFCNNIGDECTGACQRITSCLREEGQCSPEAINDFPNLCEQEGCAQVPEQVIELSVLPCEEINEIIISSDLCSP